jgi:uncharacterized protein YjbI with pentapeptide repeats
LSIARADDAYWADVDFSYADFYRAHMNKASLKSAILCGAQFRETELKNAVLIKANCEETNFKLADLREADLTEAKLKATNFEGSHVYGAVLTGVEVDISPAADGSEMQSVRGWLSQHGIV